MSNANPARRHPLCLATSDDGVTFTRLVRLPIPAALPGPAFDETTTRYGSTKYDSHQYPHVIEHDGRLLVAFSRRKQTVEVIRISLDEIEMLHD